MHSNLKSHKMKTDLGKINRTLLQNGKQALMKERSITRLCSRLAHTRLLVGCLIFFYCQEKVNKQNKTKTKATRAVAKEEHPKGVLGLAGRCRPLPSPGWHQQVRRAHVVKDKSGLFLCFLQCLFLTTLFPESY